MTLLRRTPQEEIDMMAQQIKESKDRIPTEPVIGNTGNFQYGTISTGSTLADLALSGSVYPGGGLPGGIIVEIFGPESSGKTAFISEIVASAQSRGGTAKIRDPEGRYNAEYARIYGVEMENVDYDRPDTVNEVFQDIFNWDPEESSKNKIDVFACDSLAALSTEMEMESEDKMGGKRAKDFSSGLRRVARIVSKENRLVVFTNQIRGTMASFGPKETTPGGKAIRFYASVRARLSVSGKVKRKIQVNGKDYERVIGILSKLYVAKSSIDNPYREADVYIMFGYGIDDIRANLQYLKDAQKLKVYPTPDGWSANSLEKAINRIEERGLEQELKKLVIEFWMEIENQMKIERKPKVRF